MNTPKRRRAPVKPLAPRWQRLMQVLREYPRCTISQLAERLGKNPDTVLSDISQMRAAGVAIETIYSYGDTRYRLPEQPFTLAQNLALQLTMHLDELSQQELEAFRDAIDRTIAGKQSHPDP